MATKLNTDFDLKSVSLITKVINRPDCLILDERTGEVIQKDDVKALAIISDNQKYEYLNALPKERRRTRKRKAVTEEDDVSFSEVDSDDALVDGEEVVSNMSDDELCTLIARELKINIRSTSVLVKNGWYVIPAVSGMKEFRPLVIEPIKNGYRLILKNEAIFTLEKCPFDDNTNWGYNPCVSINEELEAEYGRRGRFFAAAPFRHHKFDRLTMEIKQAVKSAEMAQKTRIKVGNNLIAVVYNTNGMIGFNELKENAAKDGGKDINDTKVLDLIEDEFHYINNTIETETNSIDKQISKLLDTIETSENPEEDVKKFLEKAAIKKYRKAINDGIKSEKEMELFVKNHGLKYIKTYGLYTMVREYLNYLRIETDAVAYMKDLVHSHKLWQNYLIGIKGCGEVIAAHIIANFNIRITEHPSAFLRYCGLDQIIIKPEEGYEPTTEDMIKAMTLARLDYIRIVNRAKMYNQDEEGIFENFSMFSTDTITTYDEFTEVRSACVKYGIDIENPLLDVKKGIFANIGNIMLNNKIRDMILRACNNSVIDIDNSGIPKIKKRARSMRDKEMTTYISKDGSIKTKNYLGYNTAIKGKLMGVLFGVFLKQKDSSGYAQLYREYRTRLEQRPDIKASIEAGNKLRVHNMARRYVIQEFLKDLWMAWRQIEGLPLNGGTYEEAKLGIIHRQGNRPELLAEPKKLKKDVAAAW